MGIIIKFLIKNIKEKKLRTFLIIFSITLSTALFFASNALSTTLTDMLIKEMRTQIGSAEIIIYSNELSPTPYVDPKPAENLGNKLEYVIGTIELTGYYKASTDDILNINILGYDYGELQKMNPIHLISSQNLEPFTGRKIIISETFAEKYKLELGSPMDLEIQGTKQRFRVSAIAASKGLLKENDRNIPVIIPRETIASLAKVRGKSFLLYIKTAEGENIPEILNELSALYNRYTVREFFSEEEILQQLSMIRTPFLLITLLVLFMSIFIIYTSFKVITMERLPVIGTFRSIGATKKMTSGVLLLESILYGIIGGVSGCVLGIGVLYGMAAVIANDPYMQIDVSIKFTFGQLRQALTLAIVLSSLSALLPVLKISKIPVKDIVLNNIEKKYKKKKWKLYFGIGFLSGALILPPIIPHSIAFIINAILMIAVFVALIYLIPYLSKVFICLFEKIYIFFFGNIGVLGAKNLRENKSILNNISLLTIGIASIIMINSVNYSMNIEVLDAYKELNYDIQFYIYGMDRRFEQVIKSTPGIAASYGIYGSYDNILVKESGQSLGYVQGIDVSRFLDFYDYDIEPELLKKLDTGRYILLTYAQGKKHGVNIGDTLTLNMKKGERKYTVLGFFNALTLMYNGQYALIAQKYYKNDMDSPFYDELALKTSKDPEEMVEILNKKFKRNYPYINSVNQLRKDIMQSNSQMMGLLQGFSFMTVIIGIFGVLNNLLISFLERKRQLAIMRSIGMEKKQNTKMLFIESLTGGLIGSITGVIGGIFVNYVIEHLLEAMNLPMNIHLSPSLFVSSFIIGTMVMVVASISPNLKSSKYNIIEAIKYE